MFTLRESALEQADIPMRRKVGIPAIYKGKPLQLGFRADILAGEIVVSAIKADPAYLSAHDTLLRTYTIPP